MPWKKSFFRTKKQKYTRKGIPKAVVPKKVTDKHIAQVAKKAIRQRQEEKVVYYGFNGLVPCNGEFVGPIVGGINQNLFRVNVTQQGDSSTQRDGLEIESVKFEFSLRGYFQNNVTTSGGIKPLQLRYRVIVFWYRQSDNNVLSTAEYPMQNEMFEKVSDLVPSSNVDSMINHTFKQHFNILYDRVFKVDSLNNLQNTLHKTIYLKNKKIKYVGDFVANTSPMDHALMMLVVSDNVNGVGPATDQIFKMDVFGRYTFRDI